MILVRGFLSQQSQAVSHVSLESVARGVEEGADVPLMGTPFRLAVPWTQHPWEERLAPWPPAVSGARAEGHVRLSTQSGHLLRRRLLPFACPAFPSTAPAALGTSEAVFLVSEDRGVCQGPTETQSPAGPWHISTEVCRRG